MNLLANKIFLNSTRLVLFFALYFTTIPLNASDITEILPLTKNIIMLHFTDGYAVYHKKGQPRSNERVVTEPLDVSAASSISNYIISSKDDPSFSTGLTPSQIGRKTKGAEFTWMCQNWNNTTGCSSTDPDHVKEHWVYLYLPSPMKSGKTYTIHTKSLAGNGTQWILTFDETKTRSEAVHVNQIGYAPSAPKKYGYVYHWLGDKGGLDLTSFANNTFNLIDITNGQSVFSGKLTFRKSKTNPETQQSNDTPNANFLSADVYECDFSAFNTPGEYILSVEGIGCSFPFMLNPDVYRMPYYTTIRGLYHNRSGIELKKEHTEYTRPAPHNPKVTPGFAGKLHYTSSRFVDWKNGDNDIADKPVIEAGDKGTIDTWGWYQDAGDWDTYYSHLNVPAMLMFTWEAAPMNFGDNELNIPESGNGNPDILDEASWLLRFYYRTRHEIIKKGYGTGGIGTRVFGDLWGGDEAPNGTGRGSWEDNTRTWYVSGEDPFSTYKYAALAAQMAYCLKKGGFKDTIDWKKESIEAYEWAKNNTRPGDEGSKPAIGFPLKDIRAFASASLYRITGDIQYQNQLKIDVAGIMSNSRLSDEARWAPFAYIGLPDTISHDTDLMSRLKGAVFTTADNIASTASSRACRLGGDYSMPMLIGQSTTPLIFEVIMGYALALKTDVSKANNYLSCLYTTSDYFLGCNALNTTWITGLGKRNPVRVFHMDSWYNGKPDMAPGITPYGPWRFESWTDGKGPWDMRWPYKTLFPADINTWPGHERWFNNYSCPMNAEFTIHQNTVLNASVFGVLCSPVNHQFEANKRPSITITAPIATGETIKSDSMLITTNTSDPDGNSTIYKVEFYNGWHKIGESFKAPYSLLWKNLPSGKVKLNARVIDKYGSIGRSDTLSFFSPSTMNKSSLSKQLNFEAFPNPFNTSITFDYKLETDSNIQIEILGTDGKKIRTIQCLFQKAGSYAIQWNGTDSNNVKLSPGIYLCKYEIRNKNTNLHDFVKMVMIQ